MPRKPKATLGGSGARARGGLYGSGGARDRARTRGGLYGSGGARGRDRARGDDPQKTLAKRVKEDRKNLELKKRKREKQKQQQQQQKLLQEQKKQKLLQEQNWTMCGTPNREIAPQDGELSTTPAHPKLPGRWGVSLDSPLSSVCPNSDDSDDSADSTIRILNFSLN